MTTSDYIFLRLEAEGDTDINSLSIPSAKLGSLLFYLKFFFHVHICVQFYKKLCMWLYHTYYFSVVLLFSVFHLFLAFFLFNLALLPLSTTAQTSFAAHVDQLLCIFPPYFLHGHTIIKECVCVCLIYVYRNTGIDGVFFAI